MTLRIVLVLAAAAIAATTDTFFVDHVVQYRVRHENKIEITFAKAPGAIGYNIYASEKLSDPPKLIGSVNSIDCLAGARCRKKGIFLDSPGTYFFRVSWVDSGGREVAQTEPRAFVYSGRFPAAD